MFPSIIVVSWYSVSVVCPAMWSVQRRLFSDVYVLSRTFSIQKDAKDRSSAQALLVSQKTASHLHVFKSSYARLNYLFYPSLPVVFDAEPSIPEHVWWPAYRPCFLLHYSRISPRHLQVIAMSLPFLFIHLCTEVTQFLLQFQATLNYCPPAKGMTTKCSHACHLLKGLGKTFGSWCVEL